MIDGGRRVGIEHAVYGSFSGDRDYHILAASAKVGRKERASIVPFSNLGISVLKGSDSDPIYAFYELETAPGVWAFSRTVFLGSGGRGNEYLAHVLVLKPAVLQAVRGDVFLLEELVEWIEEKPTTGELNPLVLDLEKSERLSRRSRRIEAPAYFRELLSILAVKSRSIAVPLQRGRDGTDFCRKVLSVLPPEDREGLSFCSRFSQPRGLKFRLRIVLPGDVAELKPYLAGVDLWGPDPRPGVGQDAFETWTKMAEPGFEPLYGIRALQDPGEAVRLTQGVAEWARWTRSGRRGLSPVDGPDGPQLVALVQDRRNRGIESVQDVRAEASLLNLRNRVVAVLQGDKCSVRSLLGDACQNVWEEASPTLMDGFFQLSGVRRRHTVDTTAGIALALLGPERVRLERIYQPGGEAWLPAKEEAAEWILDLQRANPAALLELLQSWFVEWHRQEGSSMLGRVMDILEMVRRLEPAAGRPEAIRTAITVLEATAPDVDRRAWFLKLFREARSRLADLFPDPQAARLALDGGILQDLSDAELAAMIPQLVTTFAQRVAKDVQEIRAPKVLAPLLRACRDALQGLALAGRRDEQWELASQVAKHAARLAKEDQVADVIPGLTALLWEASRLFSPVWRIASEDADQRWSDALHCLVLSNPRGFMDVVAWIAYRFCRSGFDSVVENGSYVRFRRQALRDAFDSACPEFLCQTLIRLADLDRRRLLFERATRPS